MFYIYFWLRENGLPYYVGKGSYKKRAFERHKVGNTVRYAPPKNRIVILPLSSEQEAFEAEVNFIFLFGRKDQKTGCLRNQTDGGEGSKGTNEGHRRQAEALRGRSFSEAHKEAIRVSKLGNQARLGKRKLMCKRGHDLTDPNSLYISEDHRECMECKKSYYRRKVCLTLTPSHPVR